MSQSINDKINAIFSRMQRDLQKNTDEILDEEQKINLRKTIKKFFFVTEKEREEYNSYKSEESMTESLEFSKEEYIAHLASLKTTDVHMYCDVFSDSSFDMCNIMRDHIEKIFEYWLSRNM